jgi:hypothetical protein
VSAIEASGVLVLATRGGKVAVDEMRGMSLYFDVLPVIVLNGSDYPRPRLFSLLHEFAHLVLHTEGLCDVVTDDQPRTADRSLEARCNAIAAAVLMPAAEIRARQPSRFLGTPESAAATSAHPVSGALMKTETYSAAGGVVPRAVRWLQVLTISRLSRWNGELLQRRRTSCSGGIDRQARRRRPGGVFGRIAGMPSNRRTASVGNGPLRIFRS